MRGKPVIINHKSEISDDDKVGIVNDVWFNPDDGWYWCNGVIWDETAQNLITDKGWSVSCSYCYTKCDDTGGTENNIPYDIEFLDGEFEHLAIVDNPRYERANIVFNSKTEVINDKWITIHPNGEDSKGRPLLLKDGENVYEAMQRQWGISSPGQQHLFSVSKYKTDDNYKKELDAKIAELNKQVEESRQEEARRVAKKIKDNFLSGNMPMSEYSKKAADFEKKYGVPLHKVKVENFDPNQKRDKKGRWTKENYNAEIDKILKGELKSADRIKVVEHPSDPWLKAGLQDAEMLMSVKTYGKATTDKHNVSEETMRNLPDLIDDPLYIFKSSTVPGSFVGILDDYEEENGIKKPLIAVVKPEHGKIDVNLIPSVYGKDPDFPYREVFKNNLLYERLDKNKTVSNNIIASIAMETLKPSNNIIPEICEDFNPNIKNNVQNNKEQDMALIDELKKLITKVENDKGEDMDDNKEKVENEKVDKRKLIDEVAGIMKSAGADDEKIRTAIAKMEKLAYDESEAGTADNEKEDDSKSEKDTADNKKVKNEETKEDEKKYDDLKKDVKEDVQNKCKNSVDNSKGGYFDKMNEIYNAATQPAEENTYISREQKLKYAEEYFAK